MINETCVSCGKVRALKRASLYGWCRSCAKAGWREYYAQRRRKEKQRVQSERFKKNLRSHIRSAWTYHAVSQVSAAVRDNRLPRLSEVYIACVDCGKRATDWEHRDYTKPLDVAPCCRSCNSKRGNAYFPWHYPVTERSMKSIRRHLDAQRREEMKNNARNQA